MRCGIAVNVNRRRYRQTQNMACRSGKEWSLNSRLSSVVGIVVSTGLGRLLYGPMKLWPKLA